MENYRKGLQNLITNAIDIDGGPQQWGVSSYKEVVNKEIEIAGSARQYAQSGSFPYKYDDIKKFMIEHGQDTSENELNYDKYFNDLAQAIEHYQEPKPEIEQKLDHKKLTKEVYDEAIRHQGQAFTSEENLKQYLQEMGQIPVTDKQPFNAQQINLLVAEGIADQNPVLSSVLEKNYISYKNAEAIGAVPVSIKQDNGEYETHVEPVFNLKEIGAPAVAKINQGTVRDYTRFSHEDKKSIMQGYYQQDDKHRNFKATGDPDKDLQVAKNRAADYLAKRQLKIWGKDSKPTFKNLNLEKVQHLDKAGQLKFISDVVKSVKVITNDVKKQLLVNEKQRTAQRVLQHNQALKPVNQTINPKM
ncbi:hypothetical protein EFN43_02105 [Pediococcus pentosaceus]|uniref:hypothetical protein n=1 Tax=Pediococcus pentosaceus TaxID=1255 RepID=UPI0021A81625|nr:hypothetical protein [Pediococcus pentosaceus]MCT3019880.1 hypothetical protein [Pediococcus pentosaceus]